MFKRTLPIDKISLYPFSIVSRDVITKGMLFLCAPIIYGAPGKHRELMRQPARVLLHCAKVIQEPAKYPGVSAQWIHEAAREGRARFLQSLNSSCLVGGGSNVCQKLQYSCSAICPLQMQRGAI